MCCTRQRRTSTKTSFRERASMKPLAIALLRRLGDGDEFVRREIFADGLRSPGRPGDFNARDLLRIAQPEVERHHAMAEIARLAVIYPMLRFPAGGERDARADAV